MSKYEADAFYVDLHCHPALKPLGKSFKSSPKGVNHKNSRKRNSIWKYNPPSLTDKLLNYLSGLTKFSQANFTSLAKGEVAVVCASLYPIEKWFFVNKINKEVIKDIAANFATGVGRKRVNHIQGLKDYYEDLLLERDFYQQLSGKVISIGKEKFSYQIVRSYEEIEAIQNKPNSELVTVCVLLSIEGLHVLNSDIEGPLDEAKIMSNLMDLKQWDISPFFVSLAHHFWNHLCGHAKSFSGIVEKFVDQSEGLNTGMTDLGWKVLNELLSTENGRRIYIDIKHMSTQSRKEYYEFLDKHEEYKELPIIVSHGAVNGFKSFDDPSSGESSVVAELNPVDINIFNHEIVRIAKSKGIIGLQLDERRLASEASLKNIKKSKRRGKILHYRSKLLWNQIQHIVELLDANNLFAWDCIGIGSDFDGIIDPLNGYWTAEEFPYMESYLERHAYKFVSSFNSKVPSNKLNADEIVDRVMGLNGKKLIQKFYH